MLDARMKRFLLTVAIVLIIETVILLAMHIAVKKKESRKAGSDDNFVSSLFEGGCF